eukprot:SAG31_NODE_683_length_12836_cov_8.304938_11_plen_165_part_00
MRVNAFATSVCRNVRTSWQAVMARPDTHRLSATIPLVVYHLSSRGCSSNAARVLPIRTALLLFSAPKSSAAHVCMTRAQTVRLGWQATVPCTVANRNCSASSCYSLYFQVQVSAKCPCFVRRKVMSKNASHKSFLFSQVFTIPFVSRVTVAKDFPPECHDSTAA